MGTGGSRCCLRPQTPLMPEAAVARGTPSNTSKLKQNSISGHITHKTQFGQERFAGQTILILEHNMGACLPAFRGKKGFLKNDRKSQKKEKVIYKKTLQLGTSVHQLPEEERRGGTYHHHHTVSNRLVFRTHESVRSESSSSIHVRLFVIPWTVARQAPLSVEFFRQGHWSGLPFPTPGDLPDPGIEPGSPAMQADSLLSRPPGKPP